MGGASDVTAPTPSSSTKSTVTQSIEGEWDRANELFFLISIINNIYIYGFFKINLTPCKNYPDHPIKILTPIYLCSATR